jgi:type I restriction enzyme, S subunit
MITCELYGLFTGVILTIESWPLLTFEEAGITLHDCVHDTPKSTESGYPWISIPEMKNGFLDYASARTISEEDFTKWTKGILPQKNDVVISRRTNPGVHAPVLDDTPFALGQNLVILRSDGTKVLPEFLRILIASFHWDNQVFSFINTGAVFESLTCYDIQKKMRLPIPSKTIQKRIFEIMNPIDSNIQIHAPILDTVQSIASALFRSWFIDFDPVKAKAEGKLPFGMNEETAALFPDSFEDSKIGPIPVGWKLGSLKDIKFIKGKVPKVNSAYSKIPLVNMEYIKSEKLTMIDSERTVNIDSGDIIMLMDGENSGFVTQSPIRGALGSTFAHLKVDNTDKNLVYYLLLNKEYWIRRNTTGTGIPHVDKEIVRRIQFAIPPSEIVNIFSEFAQNTFELLQILRIKNTSLSRMKGALFPRLMSGKLLVP